MTAADSSDPSLSCPGMPAVAERLAAEIQRLKRDERPIVVRTLSETARAHGMGDISAAKAALAAFDARVAQLEVRLHASRSAARAGTQPVDPTFVGFGARVTCRDTDGALRVMLLVSPEEAGVAAGSDTRRVSWNAPIARALDGARVGHAVEVGTPRGPICLEVVEISYSGPA